MEKIKAMPKLKQTKMRPLFSHAARCEIDGQGRILLPQNLRDFAGLTRDVTVVGAGETVEFWDKDTWTGIDAVETTPENIADVFAELDF
jgi:MraZ protein